MLVRDILDAFETEAPFSLQASYDNSGLQLGRPDMTVERVLVCLDVTSGVLQEAIDNECGAIVSHHPLIFEGLKRISGENETEAIVMEAIRHNIAIISVHTNLDAVVGGVNHILANKLGLEGAQVLAPERGLLKKLITFCPSTHADSVRMALFNAGAGHIGAYDCCSYNIEGYGTFRAGKEASPYVGKVQELHTEPEVRVETIFPAYIEKPLISALLKAHPYEEVAYDIYSLDNRFDRVGPGVIGTLREPMTEAAFLNMVKECLGIPCVRHTPLRGTSIQLVALCGGSGGFLIDKAISRGADAFLTAEIKYNQFMDARKTLLLVDAGHYETEQFTKELLASVIQKKLINFAVLISQVNTNPVKYT